MKTFFMPECPACGHSVPRINQADNGKTQSKRSCPRCHRRFLFTIVWHADRKVDVDSERIPDYVPPRKRG